MSLIMYLNRAPRYKDITIQDIKLMESFFRWHHENETKGSHSGGSFEQWCGHSESELPNLHTIKYFYEFYKKRTVYAEGVGAQEVFSILEQTSRIVKANQIFGWFYKNVMHKQANKNYFEVTKSQLESLLSDCKKVKDSFVVTENNKYIVDESIAKEHLPVFENGGYFFGSINYDETYAKQVVDMITIIEDILEATNFDKQVIYFNAIW